MGKKVSSEVTLRLNEVEIRSSLVEFFSQNAQFLSVDQVTSPSVTNSEVLFETQLKLTNKVNVYERSVPSIIELVGDIAGFFAAIWIIFNICIQAACATHFTNSLIKDTFWVRDYLIKSNKA